VNQFPKKKDVSLEAALHISMLISWQNISMLITPPKLTWNLKMNYWKRRFLLKTILFRFHVNLRGCVEHVHLFFLSIQIVNSKALLPGM